MMYGDTEANLELYAYTVDATILGIHSRDIVRHTSGACFESGFFVLTICF